MSDQKLFVEQRKKERFAISKTKSKRASVVKPSQRQTIQRVLEFGQNVMPSVEGERNIDGGQQDKWRKA
jgi:hypothetical protein